MANKPIFVDKYFEVAKIRDELVEYWKHNPSAMKILCKNIGITRQVLNKFLSGFTPTFESMAKIDNYLRSLEKKK